MTDKDEANTSPRLDGLRAQIQTVIDDYTAHGHFPTVRFEAWRALEEAQEKLEREVQQGSGWHT